MMIVVSDQRRLGQILKDAYSGIVQQSQTEQLAHAVAQQNIKVHGASCANKCLTCIFATAYGGTLL